MRQESKIRMRDPGIKIRARKIIKRDRSAEAGH
jgi:hypothetical protein